MEPAVRQVVEGGAEHVGVPVRLQVVPDLQAPCDAREGKEGGGEGKRPGFKINLQSRHDDGVDFGLATQTLKLNI